MDDTFDDRLTSLAALGEPVRRALYRYVVSADRPVSRDQAAEALAVPRHVAKFHLDRLEDDGLLEAEFRRPPGRSGPGAGRPAKVYRRSAREVAVSLPDRRYDLAGRIMAAAISSAEREGTPVGTALREAAAAFGRELAEGARTDASRAGGSLLETARQVLADYGYEPRGDAAGLTLANCPFHALAQDYTDLVCGMNLDLLRGFLEGLNAPELEARLDPAPGRCCVTVCRR
ncbi:MAG: helix-turn-helix transcriptional regulator [Hyphomicrobiales bacterium]